LDGTNAQILIEKIYTGDDRWTNDDDFILARDPTATAVVFVPGGEFCDDRYVIRVGSRNRWITPGKSTDNAGFAGWVKDNAKHVVALGEGRHYGEWWGKGIQRGYDQDQKHFSLFNVARWNNENTPAGIGVVPTLYTGPFDTFQTRVEIEKLMTYGSVAAPGYMNPEGIIVFHTALNAPFKVTCVKDESPKGQA